MGIARNATVGIVAGLGWLALVNGGDFMVAVASPHGLAAFVYAGFFLSVVGPIVQLIHFLAFRMGWVRFSVEISGALGLASGAGSFAIAAKSLIPKDPFGIILFVYLCVLGAVTASLLALALLKLHGEWWAEDEARV